MLTASCKRDLSEHLLEINHDWLTDRVRAYGDVADDILLACPGVEEAMVTFKWDGRELFEMTPYIVDEIKEQLRDARDYPAQVRRDGYR